MRIGQLADQTGVSVATIRYYEQEGLLDKPPRSNANYRHYGVDAARRLAFIRRCRSLDIGMTEIRLLLKLAAAPNENCGDIDAMLDEHISKVRQQRRDLVKLERELKALRADCHPSKQVRSCGILRDTGVIMPSKEILVRK